MLFSLKILQIYWIYIMKYLVILQNFKQLLKITNIKLNVWVLNFVQI